MDLKFVVTLLVGLLLLPAAHAVTEGLYLENCGLTGSTSVSCGDTITATCTVLDTFAGVSSVNSVTFNIGGRQVSATRTSGTVLNGTWTATVSVVDSTPNGTLVAVSAVDSSSNTCSGNANKNADGCFLNFTSSRSYTSSCACTFTTTTSCATNNVATITHTASVGCSQPSYSTTSVCDYCDPQWQVSELVCEINKTQSILVNGNPLQGLASAQFVSGNPSCCATTGLDSDCTPPTTSGSFDFACTLDAWVGIQQWQGGERGIYQSGSLQNLSSVTSVSVTTEQALTQDRRFQPIVFDVDNDGEMEAVVLLDGGEIAIYNNDLSTKEYSLLPGGVFKGDPAMFEFSPKAGGWDSTSAWEQEVVGAGIAVIVSNGLENRFITYRYNDSTSSFQQLVNVSLPDNSSSTYLESQTPWCGRDDCVVVIGGAEMRHVNPVTGALTSSMGFPGANYTASARWRNSPIRVGLNTYVAKGFGADGFVHVYACNSACADVAASQVLWTSEDVFNVSELTGGPVEASLGSDYYPIYWTEVFDESNVTEAWLRRVYVRDISTPTSTGAGNGYRSLTVSGTEPECASSPARASCSSGAGVAVVTGQVATSALTTLEDFTGDARDYQLAVEASTVSPFNGYDLTVSTGLQFIDCRGSSRCFAISADPTGADVPHLWLKNGILWSEITVPFTQNGSEIISYAGWLSDTKFFILESNIFSVSAPTSKDLNAHKVWVYNVGTSSWSNTASFNDELSVRYPGGAVIPHMINKADCDQGDGCHLFAYQFNSIADVGRIVDISSAGVVTDVFYPKGTVGGSPANTTYEPYETYIDSSGNRYVLMTSGSSSALVQYVGGSEVAAATIQIVTESATKRVLYGLVGDGNTVYWSNVAVAENGGSGSTNCTSAYSSSYEFRSPTQDILNVVTGASTTVQSCYSNVYRFAGLSPTLLYSANVTMGQNVGIHHLGVYSSAFSVAGLDGDGDYYSLTWLSRLARNDGVLPYLLTEGSAHIPVLVDNSTQQVCAVPSSTCGLYAYPSYVCSTATNCSTFSTQRSFDSSSARSMIAYRNARSSYDWTFDYFGSTGGSESADLTEYSCYVDTVGGGLQKASSTTRSGTYCPLTINAFDVDRDGLHEIVSYDGVFKTSGLTNRLYTFTGTAEGDAVATVDITADTYKDFLFVTASAIRRIVSRPSIVASYHSSLSSTGASCSYDNSTRKVTVFATGVGAQNPGSLTSSITLRKEGAVVGVSGVTSGISSSLTLSSGGTYNATVLVTDTVTGETTSESCLVVVPSIGTSVSSVDACSIDPDGEFNFINSVQDHDWLVDVNRREPTMNGAVAKFRQAETNILHGIGSLCADQGISVKSSVNMSSTSDLLLSVEGVYNGLSYTTAAVQFLGGDLYAVTGSGSEKIATVGTNAYHEVELRVYVAPEPYFVVLLDGSEKVSSDLLNPVNGYFSVVKLQSASGSTDVDYVRIVGLTGVARSTLNASQQVDYGAKQNLLNCTVERNFTRNPVGEFVYYEHISSYCTELTAGKGRSYCTIDELQAAVKFNSNCFKEAFDYCVDVSYPLTAAFQDGSVVADQSTGLDGASACNIALSIGVGTNKVIKPIWSVLWSIIRSNMLLAAVLIFLVAVYLAASARKRAGG